MASRMRWKDPRYWRIDLKRFLKRHDMTQVVGGNIASIHAVVLSDYIRGARNTSTYGRRGIIALLEDWEDANAKKLGKE